MTPLTVILPVRNGASTIVKAVRSTLRALPPDAALLVHDDASTDRTAEVLAGIKDSRLSVLRSTSGRGVAGGLNHLLEHVTTPLVARMDADDITLPWRYRLQLRALQSGADVVFSTVVEFGDVGPARLRPGPPLSISPSAMALHLLLANPVAHSTMLGRTEAVRRLGGYQAVPAEDYDLWLRMAADGLDLARLAAPCLLYRVHSSQVTASADWVARSLADESVRTSYAALSRRVLGCEPTWLDALRGTEVGGGRTETLTQFRTEMTRAAGSLPGVQRHLLLTKLNRATR